MTATTSDVLISPVTLAEMADYIGVDISDTLVEPMLLAATDAVIRVLGYDLEPRDWTLTLWDWPSTGARTSPNLSPSLHSLMREINLPYAALQAVASVTVYGVLTTDYVSRENSIMLAAGIPADGYGDNVDPALVVEYTAGLVPVSDSIKNAIKMLASFLYENRGACDVGDALKRSGVSIMLQPFKRHAVVF